MDSVTDKTKTNIAEHEKRRGKSKLKGKLSHQNDVIAQAELDEDNQPLQVKKVWFDPSWKYDDLSDMAKKTLSLEIANPGISAADLMRLMNFDGDRKRMYAIREHPLYQKLLNEARKSEFDLIKDLQVKAAKVMAQALNSKNERTKIDAAKFLLGHSKDIATKRAELEIQREAQMLTARAQSQVQISFVMDGGVPVIGKTIMTQDGKIIPIESEEGQKVIEGEKPMQISHQQEPISLGLDAQPPPDITHEKEDGGIIGGIEE